MSVICNDYYENFGMNLVFQNAIFKIYYTNFIIILFDES